MTPPKYTMDDLLYHEVLVFAYVFSVNYTTYMRIYFSGIGGVGIGPLAEVARDAGHEIVGSDQSESLTTHALEKRGVRISTNQDGLFLETEHASKTIDWFVYTAALRDDHPELLRARELGIRISKRDELLSEIIAQKNLKLIAVAGTHGKTTTTGMLTWALQQLGIPVSYLIGTTLSWGPSGKFDPASEYFVYECDEFDRNFLKFHPHLSLITSIEHDHPDTYPTEADYFAAFGQFAEQSDFVIGWHDELKKLTFRTESWQLNKTEVQDLPLAGAHNRRNGTLVYKAIERLATFSGETSAAQVSRSAGALTETWSEAVSTENGGLDATKKVFASFPGTNRRFERLAENLYTDYGHTPTEIAATLQMARELSDDVILVYQPHQNVRQHEIREQYTDDIFKDASKVYWLPTYLSREVKDLEVLTPEQLTEGLSNIHIGDLDETLWQAIQSACSAGRLVLCMGAGSIDSWVRTKLTK